mmetsp:Transcript_50955/g.159787  ORF Transcript_50955/g.159787 Transcript_50955/m.159787 type:complete len:382 (+) Transcript_50955:49-1194(+)
MAAEGRSGRGRARLRRAAAATALLALVRPAVLLHAPQGVRPADLALAVPGSPRHLVVLQHGLSGTAGDLRLLGEELSRRSGGRALVLSAASNQGQNRDGIAAGGKRLVREIRSVVTKHHGLAEISLVGNSLGGLYTRFAVSELLEESGLVGGLRPAAFVTIGCPHLGVRSFTFLPLPPSLQSLARFFVGQTGEELMLRDAEGLVQRMAEPGSRFLAALRSFRRRALYANLWGDFMVPFGTAAIEPSWGPGFSDEQNVESFLARPGVEVLSQPVLQRDADGLAARLQAPAADANREAEGEAAAGDGSSAEAAMATSLEACGWSKFAVAFRGTGTWFPMAHNKIAALRREGWRRYAFSWLEGTEDGDELMGHMADYILASAGS